MKTYGAAEQRLSGMDAIVTGGAKGIGLGIAQALAKQGAHVHIWDTDDSALSNAVYELAAVGARVTVARVDVTDPDNVNLATSNIMATSGKVDILVNNAGIGGDRLVTKMELDFWERVLKVNLTSQYLCVKAVVPSMVERGFGRIVNLSSRAWLGNRGQASYSASKGGVVSLTRTLALEFARSGITANCIAPGLIDTPLFRTLESQVQDSLRATVPMRRMGTPADIAHAVRMLVDPDAGYITGQTLYVCGGRSLSSASV